MDITSLLTDDGSTEAVRGALLNAQGNLREAARHYAEASLTASNETLKCVQTMAPCCEVWPHMVKYQEFMTKAQDALSAVTQVTGMLLMVEDSGDDHVNERNREAHLGSLKIPVVSALLEGANTRMNIALQGIPTNGAPGQRCNPEALSVPPED